jgi:acetate---CoA ligase (ADP-forming)
MTNTVASLESLFHPRSVAVIGASSDRAKISGRSLRYLLEKKFAGPVYAINSRVPEVQGIPTHPSMAALKDPVDLAIVVVPAASVVQSVEECAAKGVKSVVIFSSGFAEVDAEGRAMQERLTAIAREARIRIVGPNCMGVFDPARHMYATFSTSFDHGFPQPGSLGIASQSGAFGAHCFVTARERGLGFSLWATTGNECDVDFAECLEYMAHDPATKVVLGYLEGCRDKDRLVRALEAMRDERKPLVMLKVGRSEVGAQAAASHTASLVGSDRVYDALFRQYGVHRAGSIEELMDVGYACTAGRFPTAGRVGLVSISGGVGVLMADAASEVGLEVPEMPQAAQAKLKALLPYAAVRNPIDTTAQVLNDLPLIGTNLEVMFEEGGCDCVVMFLSTVGMNPVMMPKLEVPLIKLRERFPDPVAVVSMMSKRELIKPLENAGYLVMEDATNAMHAVGALVAYGRFFARKDRPDPLPVLPATPPLPKRALSEFDAKRILAEAGIPVAPEKLATTAQEAQRAADVFGYPVVMKIASPDIAHKSEIGGVLLGIASVADVATGFTMLLERAKHGAPGAKVEGVLVAPQIQGGVEVILGVQRDPVFGPVVMFGLGGIFVEVLKDVTLRIAPFGVEEARRMIREVKGFPLLDGARGRPKADVEALAQVLARLSVYAAARADDLETLDINPFLVLPAGKGGMAVDALIVARM